MDLAVILLFLLVGLIEIISVLLVNRRISYEHDFMVERGTAGEQLGEWLTSKESKEEDAPMMIDVLAQRVGRQLFASQKFSLMQEASVDMRTQNRWDSQVKEAIQAKMPPHYKILKRVAEGLGFDFDDILTANEVIPFMKSLKKSGIGIGQFNASSSMPNYGREE